MKWLLKFLSLYNRGIILRTLEMYIKNHRHSRRWRAAVHRVDGLVARASHRNIKLLQEAKLLPWHPLFYEARQSTASADNHGMAWREAIAG